MVVIANDPYAKEKQELLKSKKDTPEKIAELDQKSREFTDSLIANQQEKLETLQTKTASITEQPNTSKKYADLIRLYRDAQTILLQVRAIKKKMRNEKSKTGGKKK